MEEKSELQGKGTTRKRKGMAGNQRRQGGTHSIEEGGSASKVLWYTTTEGNHEGLVEERVRVSALARQVVPRQCSLQLRG